ncbi:MAG TPA: phosphohistidine phosphatase SixA [Bryobacteraceae bacterium]|nr:phosphohistidine phosphatase SixA [Bryobacteraceae bacterium]
MDVYILRHGEAEPRGDDVEEARRKLTPRGRADVERVSRAARGAKVAPELVFTSPFDRAKETAQIAAGQLDSSDELVETKALLPNSNPEQLWKELRTHKTAKSALVAGHEPHLSRFVAYLLGSPSLSIDLKKGALVRVTVDIAQVQPHGALKWLLTPRLSGLGKTKRK